MLFGLASLLGSAQLDLPVPLVLDGATAPSRQVTGLADPTVPDALMSARALRSTSPDLVTVQGTGVLLGALVPTPTQYHTGMMVTVVPEQANAASAVLNLNGLGPRFIVKTGGVALDSADLHPGIPVRLIYDGDRFQLLSSTQMNCPVGYHAATREYCIADSSGSAVSFFVAATNCAARGARLCTMSEWAIACYRLPGFLGSVSTAEWVDHAANNAATAKVVGAGNNGEVDLPGTGCNYGGWGLPANPFRYRCCSGR